MATRKCLLVTSWFPLPTWNSREFSAPPSTHSTSASPLSLSFTAFTVNPSLGPVEHVCGLREILAVPLGDPCDEICALISKGLHLDPGMEGVKSGLPMTYLRNTASTYQFQCQFPVNFSLSVSIPEMFIKHRPCSSTVRVIKIKQI